jgi:hypothetical protein
MAAGLCLLAVMFFAACGGDDDNGGDGADGTGTASSQTRTGTPGTRTGTPDGEGDGTAAPGTPGGASLTAAAAGGTPPPEGTLSPEQQATIQADIDNATGSSGTPPSVISTIPAPPPGVTPRVDPTSVAPPDPPSQELRLLVDMDASTAGIQTSRNVQVGDVFRVGVVIVNATGSMSAFNFQLNYDKTKVQAPTIVGGRAIDRNPDLNQAGLGGDAAGWECLPEPAGDLDEIPDSIGDGNPATGEAFLSCFVPSGTSASGTIVLGTIEFHATATGNSQLSLANVALATGTVFTELGSCAPVIDVSIECAGASVTVN